MKKLFFAAIAASLLAGCCRECGTVASVKSPDGRNAIEFNAVKATYRVLRDGVTVAGPAAVSLKLDGRELGAGASLKGFCRGRLSGLVATPVYKKWAIDLAANTLFADYGDWGVRLVARNDGVAYRFETKLKGKVRVVWESAPLVIPDPAARCWFSTTQYSGCEEVIPQTVAAGEACTGTNKFAYLPFAYTLGGKYVAVVESDVFDYPILNLAREAKGDGPVEFSSTFSRWPKSRQRIGGWGEQVVKTGGRWIRPTAFEDYLVETEGTRTFPWRGFVLADAPAAFVDADLVNALARPQVEGDDFKWVKPGKVAWDWWNCFDNKRIPENEGVNTKTYERFIDFAQQHGVEYVIFDEGWSEHLNIWKFHPSVDVEHLIKYANERGVGIILWMAWAQVFGEEDRVAEHFAKLGAKGFKVDFMDRGDAEVERFLWKFAESCRKHRMLVDYHGAHRPTGMSRAYPNVLNFEGIHGLENTKWGAKDLTGMMDSDVRAVYLRMTAGPMDYTPGAMDNYPVDGYLGGREGPKNAQPGSAGTRCRQMAMMALYEAPLQMLCDAPTKYEANPECFKFMAATPVVWADSRGLAGDPDSFAAVARRAKDGAWYAAAISNRDAREYRLDTAAFLDGGEWEAEIFRDAPEGDAAPTKYVHETKSVKAGDQLDIGLGRGGGFVARFVRK